MENGGEWLGVATCMGRAPVRCTHTFCWHHSVIGDYVVQCLALTSVLVPLWVWGRYYDHKVGKFRRKAVPLCYVWSKGGYKVNAAVARDSMKRCAAHFDSGLIQRYSNCVLRQTGEGDMRLQHQD